MLNVLTESIALYNLPFTVLLGIILVFWVFVILGFFDVEMLDFDPGDMGEFLNFGKVPFSVWLSCFSIQAWFYSMIINHTLNSVFPVHALYR